MSTERERLHNLFPDLDFDPAALREKYRIERDKRIRDDGENQYIEAASQFAHYADDDPYVDPSPYAPGINAFNSVLKEWRDARTWRVWS